jgi:cysteine desulfuration protein SufE
MTVPTPRPATINDAVRQLAETFELLGDWEERYRYIIDLGRDLQGLRPEERTDQNKVRGCASQVWLVTERTADGRLTFRGDSDAHIVRGLIAILLDFYNGRTPAEIVMFDAPLAFARLGLKKSLSRQRANGLASMVERIRADAVAPAS